MSWSNTSTVCEPDSVTWCLVLIHDFRPVGWTTITKDAEAKTTKGLVITSTNHIVHQTISITRTTARARNMEAIYPRLMSFFHDMWRLYLACLGWRICTFVSTVFVKNAIRGFQRRGWIFFCSFTNWVTAAFLCSFWNVGAWQFPFPTTLASSSSSWSFLTINELFDMEAGYLLYKSFYTFGYIPKSYTSIGGSTDEKINITRRCIIITCQLKLRNYYASGVSKEGWIP